MNYKLTRRARGEILQVWNYIAADNEGAADAFLAALQRRFKLLGRNPFAGKARDDLRPGYRSLPVGQYLIFYRVINKRVEIMHVIHGMRDLSAFFGPGQS